MSIRIRFSFFIFCLFVSRAALAQDDPMDPYRDRFRLGYEKYSAGSLGEALQYWEPIYRALGPEKGYRLSYNIALVYDALGDATRAAERYESFLEQVKARRDNNTVLEERVLQDEERARTNLEALVKSRGRIRVAAMTPPETVQIDALEPRLAGFVAYVTPGKHVVVFAPGTSDADKHELDLSGGQLIEVAMTPKKIEPKPIPMKEVEQIQRPYSLAWIFIAGGAALASIAAPVACYAVAGSQLGAIRTEQMKPPALQENVDAQTARINAYYATRAASYATLAIPIVLAAATAGLAVGWALGTKRTFILVPQQAGVALVGQF